MFVLDFVKCRDDLQWMLDGHIFTWAWIKASHVSNWIGPLALCTLSDFTTAFSFKTARITKTWRRKRKSVQICHSYERGNYSAASYLVCRALPGRICNSPLVILPQLIKSAELKRSGTGISLGIKHPRVREPMVDATFSLHFRWWEADILFVLRAY